jgi:hypothetical protein
MGMGMGMASDSCGFFLAFADDILLLWEYLAVHFLPYVQFCSLNFPIARQLKLLPMEADINNNTGTACISYGHYHLYWE